MRLLCYIERKGYGDWAWHGWLYSSIRGQRLGVFSTGRSYRSQRGALASIDRAAKRLGARVESVRRLPEWTLLRTNLEGVKS